MVLLSVGFERLTEFEPKKDSRSCQTPGVSPAEPGAYQQLVKGLGRFIELEVVLAPGQSPEEGEKIAERFRAALDIRDEDLIDCAYMDMMTARGCGP